MIRASPVILNLFATNNNSYQNTSGVCSIANENNGTSNGTELLLTGNEMVPGLHSFDCLVEESPIGMVSSNAIVVTDKAVYNLDKVPNRYLQCSLRTPAKLSDNGRILLVSIDDIEMISFAITGEWLYSILHACIVN